MITASKMAKHIEQVYFGGNCTFSNLHNQLEDISLAQANEKIASLNTILALTNHIHYFKRAQLQVLQGGQLDAHDSKSFLHPSLQTEAQWQEFKKTIFKEAREFVSTLNKFRDANLKEVFANGKYGTNLRNFLCLNEHTHYHLGQIALIKKLLTDR